MTTCRFQRGLKIVSTVTGVDTTIITHVPRSLELDYKNKMAAVVIAKYLCAKHVCSKPIWSLTILALMTT